MAPSSPSADQVAAIAAAIGRFEAETIAAPRGEKTEAIGPWQRAALVEGVGAKRNVQEHREGGVRWLS